MIKQVILIRKDLKMRRGKEIAQGSHASMAFLLNTIAMGCGLSEVEKEWLNSGATKICLVVKSEDELIELAQKARQANLKTHVIKDLGRTEFDGIETITACAIGPDLSENIDPITSHLVLY